MTTLTMAVGCMTGCGSDKEDKTTEQKTTEVEQVNATESGDTAVATDSAETDKQYADTITLVWYPNESADAYQDTRDEIGRLIEEATGKKVEQKLTTDYAIAIESLSNGTAQIGCVMGAEGYIQAKNANDSVDLLFVNSDSEGTLDNAIRRMENTYISSILWIIC